MADKDKNASADNSEKAIADAIALLKSVKDEKDDKGGDKSAQAKDANEDLGAGDETHDDENLDHGEKSRLGRKYKRLEKDLTSFRHEVIGKIDQLIDARTAAQEVDEDPEPPLSDIPTADEVREHSKWAIRQGQRTLRSETKQESEKRQIYGKEYARLIRDYVDEDEDPDLFKLLTDRKDLSFNSRLSDDPKEDFLANYRNATTHLQKSSKANVRGKETEVAIGANKGETNITRKKGAGGAHFDLSTLSVEEQQAAKLFSQDELDKMHAEGRI